MKPKHPAGRVHRARFKLVELLSIEGIDDFGRDQANRAVVAGAINMSVRYSNSQIGT